MTNNKDQILSIIKSISGQANILTVPRLFVALTGDTTLAIMLSQLIYWSDRTTRSDGFVYKSAADWAIEVGASSYSVRKFNQLPFIETKIIKANGSPTTHYRVRFDDLVNWFCRNQQMDLLKSTNGFVENGKSLTEITTETTTETTTKELKEFSAFAETPKTPDPLVEPLETDPETKKLKPKPSRNKPKPIPKIHPDYHAFLLALAGITGFDVRIKSNAARLGRASKQLLDAGYAINDLNNFITCWKDKDWRWQKNKQLPTPEDVLSQIARSKHIQQTQSAPRKDYSSWLK